MTAVAVATAAPARALERFDAWLGQRVSMRSLALLRVLIGPVVLVHLWPFLSTARDGSIYRDHFHEQYWAWYPELPRNLYVAVLWAAAVAAVAMTIGLAARLATVTTFAVVAYNLFLTTTHYHNNRAYLVVVLAALAVAPCGRELSVDAWWRARSGRPALDPTAPAWPLLLLRFEAVTVYAASGLSKLLDRDWFAGTVTWHRVVLLRHRLDDSALPGVGRRRCSPTGRSTRWPPRSSWRPSCSSPSACAGGPPGSPRCGSRSASMSRFSCRRRSRCSPSWPSPRS